jgi:hypothetical protein
MPRTLGAFLHDDAGAQKADARHDIGNHPDRAVARAHAQAQIDKGGGAHRHQHIGPQARGALPPLALKADQPAQDKGGQEGDGGVGEQLAVHVPAGRVVTASSCRSCR